MSRCLRDRTLWLLSEGEASREDRAHVASCIVCAARLRRLHQDLSQLTSVLSGTPSTVARSPLGSVGRRWMVSAAGLAALLMVAWFGMWGQQSDLPPFGRQEGQESIWPFLESLSVTLFPSVDVGFITLSDPLSDLSDLQEAITGKWPCEEPGVLANLACHDDTFALLLGEL